MDVKSEILLDTERAVEEIRSDDHIQNNSSLLIDLINRVEEDVANLQEFEDEPLEMMFQLGALSGEWEIFSIYSGSVVEREFGERMAKAISCTANEYKEELSFDTIEA